MAATFEEDLTAMGMRHKLGVENLLWASDYPHPDQTFPHSLEVIEEHFSGIPGEEKNLMIRDNAQRLYRL
jgi:predicted TIM-barrel fold metal-dependent hydrolase